MRVKVHRTDSALTEHAVLEGRDLKARSGLAVAADERTQLQAQLLRGGGVEDRTELPVSMSIFSFRPLLGVLNSPNLRDCPRG
jgi:hypothetical protein